MRLLTLGILLLAGSQVAFGQDGYRKLSDCPVTIDGQLTPLGQVYGTEDGFLLPAKQTIAAVSHGQCDVRGTDRDTTILLNGVPAIRIHSGDDDDVATFLPGYGSHATKLKYGFDTINDHLVVDPRALGFLFGDCVEPTTSGLDIRTPFYWEKLVYLYDDKNPRTAERIRATWEFLPDFGISPSATHLALWVRPSIDCFAQIYGLSSSTPTPMLGISKANPGERRFNLVVGDQPEEWSVPANHIARGTSEFTNSEGLDVQYVVVLTKKRIGDGGDPATEIATDTAHAIPDSNYAVFGVHRTVGDAQIAFNTVVVRAGETKESIASKHNNDLSVFLAVNGLDKDDELKPGEQVLVTTDEDPPRTGAKPDYKDTGMYLVQDGETLDKLCARWNVTKAQMVDANPSLAYGVEPEPDEIIERIRPIAADTPKVVVLPNASNFLYQVRQDSPLLEAPDATAPSKHKVLAGTLIKVTGVVKGSNYYFIHSGLYDGYLATSLLAIKRGTPPPRVPTPAELQAVSPVPGSNTLASVATAHLGAPYLLGGNSLQSGIDCSHFVAYALKRSGIACPDPPVSNMEQHGTIVHFRAKGMSAMRGPRMIHLPQDTPQASDDLDVLQPADRMIVQYAPSVYGHRHTGVYLGRLHYNGRYYLHAVVNARNQGVSIDELAPGAGHWLWKVYKYSCRGN